MERIALNRRLFLSGIAGLLGLGGALAAQQFAPRPRPTPLAPARPDARLLVVILRGGLDGLALIPPHGDPGYRAARGSLALDALDLDGTFGLHPALAALKPLWDRGELLPVHAVGLPYSGRSHFEAQDLLENGTARPHGSASGWMNRLIQASPRPAVAFSDRIPLLLSGAAPVQAVDPGRDDLPDAGLLDRVAALYAADPLLSAALSEARALSGTLQAGAGSDPRSEAAAIGRMLAGEARLGVVDYGGWDSHSRQGDADSGIGPRLARLGAGLAALPAAMGESWRQTAVLVITEFGRTVAPNGTGGTDHGTGGAALLCGGAIRGGRVLADWPGLDPRDRFEGRDLRTTLDTRALIAALLGDHLALPEGILYDTVLPGADALPPLTGLFRA